MFAEKRKAMTLVEVLTVISVVALLTASGLKDPDATASIQGELPSVSGDPPSVFSQLKSAKLLPV